MKESTFIDQMVDVGYKRTPEGSITWEDVEIEAAKIDAKKSSLPYASRKTVLTLRELKRNNTKLPAYILNNGENDGVQK